MTHSTFNPDDELLAGYVLGDLSADEQIRVEQHLAQHPPLATQVDQLRTTLDLLSLAASEARPPADLRDRILQAAHHLPPQRSRGGWLTARQLWGVGSSIAALALIALGVSNYRLHQELATARQTLQDYEGAIALLQQPDNQLLNLQAVSDRQSPTGSLVLAPHGDTAMLTLQNLEPLPEGMVYRMWAFADGKKFDCASFTPDASGQVFITLPMESWSNMTRVVINIEPAQPSDQVNPEMVLKGEPL